MCLMDPALVVETLPDEAIIDLAGRRLRVPNFFVPDLRAGETVVVGMGHVLGRYVPDPAHAGPDLAAPWRASADGVPA
jgi:HupF/HypC family protein